VRIVIVEDHLMFRNMIRKTCVQQFGHTVVGETDSGVHAVELILQLKPDAVILDLSLSDVDGFNVADRAFSALPQAHSLSSSYFPARSRSSRT